MVVSELRRTASTLIAAAVAVTAAGLFVAPPPPKPVGFAVRLTGGDLGDGTALVMGPSGFPIPPERYAEAMDQLYFHPNGFGGTTQIVPTPEGLYPVTGIKSLMLDPSIAQGVQALNIAVQQHLAGASAHNPIVVSGFSQSSMVSSQIMSQLAHPSDGSAAVPTGDVRFVLVGDPNAPNGGLMERFNIPVGGHSPTVPSLGISFNGATPDDLFHTDIYTNEYDGFADFPRYPINLISDLNALFGIMFEHSTYAVKAPEQIAPWSPANPDGAILLPGSEHSLTDPCAECLTDYWMMPSQTLPLLAPLQLIPFIGMPLYNLLEPDTRILVNLGYGSIDHGWDPGPANEPTTFGLFPTHLDWGEVFTRLLQGIPQGIESAVKQFFSPDNWHLTPLLENPLLEPLVHAAYVMGLTDNPSPGLLDLLQGFLGGFANFPISHATLLSPLSDIINMFSGTLSWDYSTLLPIADTFNALLTTLPSVALGFITDSIADGHLLQGIGEAVAAGVALIPFSLLFGIGAPIVEAIGGTLTNIVQLFNFGDMFDAAAAAAVPDLDLGDVLP